MSDLLRQAALALLCVVAVAVPSRAQGTPYPCPLGYGFFTTYTFVSERNYPYDFRFNTGTFSPVIGPTIGKYNFPTMTSTNGDARLYGGYIVAHCTSALVMLPPYAEPQLVLFVIDDGAGGNLQVIYSPDGGGGCNAGLEIIPDPDPDPTRCTGGGSGGGGEGGGTSGTGSGGGGGGGITCTHYVMEISYDGGETWEMIDEWWECS